MSMRPKSLADSPLPPTVTGFTGSSIWQYLYSFPPASQEMINAGYEDFAKRWTPIMDAFDAEGVNFALEVHPTEIAFDIASAERALKAIKNHPRFGFNYDPSHFGYQGVDYVKFIRKFSDRIYHAHMKDVWWGHGTGEAGVFGGHTDFCDPAATGTSAQSDTATSTSRKSSSPSTTSATRARCRSNGKTAEWTESTALRKRARASSPSTSPRATSPSTPRSTPLTNSVSASRAAFSARGGACPRPVQSYAENPRRLRTNAGACVSNTLKTAFFAPPAHKKLYNGAGSLINVF